jgi:tRNA dimethylallyltransferase
VNSKYLIIIAGPTAVGKTSVSIDLAQKLNCEIISADSRQIYKEMSIGTAKPMQEEMKGITHHFINHISIHEYFTVGDFEREVITLLDKYFIKNDFIIMCGGTGLYIDAVCNGIDDLAKVDEAIRSKINSNYNQLGLEWLQEQVKLHDPEYFSIVDQKNPARLKRALEVIETTGNKFSDQRTASVKKRNFIPIKILLNDDRELLYERINNRVDLMIKNGLIEEAGNLFPHKSLNALNTVGYKELFNYFDGKLDLDEASEEIKKNSRRYAKRQLTWFNKTKDYTIFNVSEKNKILGYINTFNAI